MPPICAGRSAGKGPSRAQQRARAGAILAGGGTARIPDQGGVPRTTDWPCGRLPARLRSGRPIRQPQFHLVPRTLSALCVCRPDRGRAIGPRTRLRASALCRPFRACRPRRHDRVVCEVNTIPPNPASDAFHAALGFVAVGTASVHGGSRTVRYLSHTLREALNSRRAHGREEFLHLALEMIALVPAATGPARARGSMPHPYRSRRG